MTNPSTTGVITLALAVLLGTVRPASALTVIDTTFAATGSITPFGSNPDSTPPYGQVLTAPAGEAGLLAFTFVIDVPATVAFRGEVYAWDGAKATGPSLYESAVTSTAGAGYQPITFDTGGVAVTPGAQYVIFASTSKDLPGHSGAGSWAAALGTTYAGGEFVFTNGPASAWTTTPWSAIDTVDAGFIAIFGPLGTAGEPVPLPSAAVTGLALCGAMATRRPRRE